MFDKHFLQLWSFRILSKQISHGLHVAIWSNSPPPNLEVVVVWYQGYPRCHYQMIIWQWRHRHHLFGLWPTSWCPRSGHFAFFGDDCRYRLEKNSAAFCSFWCWVFHKNFAEIFIFFVVSIVHPCSMLGVDSWWLLWVLCSFSDFDCKQGLGKNCFMGTTINISTCSSSQQ